MGVILSKISCIFESLRHDPARILLLGLDSVGKTTILYKMHLNQSLPTLPTIGFNVKKNSFSFSFSYLIFIKSF